MRIASIEYKAIEQARRRFAKEFRRTAKSIATISRNQAALTKRHEEKERALSSINLRRELLREALVLHNCANVQNPLREELLRAKERIKRDDITVCEQRTLEKSIADMERRLQAQCLHQLVVQPIDSYRGSHSNDYDDRHSAQRICAFCGLDDSSTTSGDEIFRDLPEAEHRIVKRACFLQKTPLVTANTDEKMRGWQPYEVHLWLPIEQIVDAFFDDRISKIINPIANK